MTPRSTSIMVALSLYASAHLAVAQPRRPRDPQPPVAPQPAAVAQPVDPLEAEHLQGVELRRQRRDGEARDLFRALFERTHEPRVLAWLSGAEGALGEWVNAEAHLSTALENTTDPWITRLRADLEADLVGFRRRLGLLDVISSTPGAEVWLSGTRTALPLERPMRVRAGTVTFEVRAEGFVSEPRTVEVPGGMSTVARETINLTPQAPRPAVVAASPAVVAAVTPPRVDPVESSSVHPLRIVGASLLGLGAVGLGLGIYGMVDYSTLRGNFVDSGCDTVNPPIDCEGFDGGDSSLTLGVTSLIAGGVFVAGGMALLLVPIRSARRSSASAITVGPGPSPLSLSLRGAF